MAKHRHTTSEIATKLVMAEEMAAQGGLQGDIAKSLGVSVMTYYRWRKARAGRPANDAIPRDHEQPSQIRDLQLENTRLRRLVTDLMLEKLQLEDSLVGSATARGAVGRN